MTPLAVSSPPLRLTGVETVNAGVIKEARRRQRRRHLRTTAALAAIAAGMVFVAAHLGPPTPGISRGHKQPSVLVAPTTVLSRAPYMGVACATPNGVACDRVGLAIWLRRSAKSVSATIAGRPVKLDWAGDLQPRFATHGTRTAFDGFLQPAGLVNHLHIKPDATAGFDPGCACQTGPIWTGDNAPSPLVRLRIDYANAKTVITKLNVILAPGWG